MSKPIRALLLSAGLGTRLKPITNEIPKCLVQIDEKPILENWICKLENVGCEAVLVNTHHFHEKVNDFITKRPKSKIYLKEKYEKKLLGTVGTLIENSNFFLNSKIIMIHADNMTNFNLKELIEADKKRPNFCSFTMLTFNTDSPKSSGIVLKDEQNVLRNFYEKVEEPPTKVANAAIYIFDYEFINKLKFHFPLAKDFSEEIIPNFLGKIFTYHTNELLIDIGTIEGLAKARHYFGN